MRPAAPTMQMMKKAMSVMDRRTLQRESDGLRKKRRGRVRPPSR
jgi:hypothetical protein